MGCISSRILVEDNTRPVFHVWNIDEDGHYIQSCHLQVTSTELVLHQRGAAPLVWPLRSLRRYGFDTELFSFECGRHCATGPAIYAFKCKQAEALFEALQECLLAPRSSDTPTTEPVSEVTEEPHSSLLATDPGPSAPPATPHRKVRRKQFSLMERLAEHSVVGLPPLGSFQAGKKFLPRCCLIGTCINASKQHYLNNKVLSKTTCGSCRTCSLNMCVVQQKSSQAVTYSDRAKQTDYGNVLDPVGRPRNCVHCCCDFRQAPSEKGGCSADDCPLHFNNCVDQITNYARLDRNNRHQLQEKATMRREKLYQMQQPPYSHVYTHIPTPVPKWPQTKSMSCRSLPPPEGSPNEAKNDDEDSDLDLLSSLSSKEGGSEPDMYAKIDFEQDEMQVTSAATQT